MIIPILMKSLKPQNKAELQGPNFMTTRAIFSGTKVISRLRLRLMSRRKREKMNKMRMVPYGTRIREYLMERLSKKKIWGGG